MEKQKKPFYKKWWFIALAVFIAIGILGNIFESDESKQAKEDERIAAEQKKEDEKAEREKAKLEKEQEKEKAKLEKEREKEEAEKKAAEEKAAIENLPIDERLVIKDNNVDRAELSENGVLTLVNEATSIWSENSLVTSYTYMLFESMHEAFKDPAVNEVGVSLETNMTDTKGNTSLVEVIKFLYTREDFEELNYEGFLNIAGGQEWRIYNESSLYHIHPGIYKNIKEDYKKNLLHGMSKFPPVN